MSRKADSHQRNWDRIWDHFHEEYSDLGFLVGRIMDLELLLLRLADGVKEMKPTRELPNIVVEFESVVEEIVERNERLSS